MRKRRCALAALLCSLQALSQATAFTVLWPVQALPSPAPSAFAPAPSRLLRLATARAGAETPRMHFEDRCSTGEKAAFPGIETGVWDTSIPPAEAAADPPLTKEDIRAANAVFAEKCNMSFPADAATGRPDVPGFYLLEDYQELFRSVEAEVDDEELCDVEGTIPPGLSGVYYVTGPGILIQDQRPVHPFDGQVLLSRM